MCVSECVCMAFVSHINADYFCRNRSWQLKLPLAFQQFVVIFLYSGDDMGSRWLEEEGQKYMGHHVEWE